MPLEPKKNMKKMSTTYSKIIPHNRKHGDISFCITVNEEYTDHISVHEIEPCSGILKHWGSKEQLIAELEEYIKAIKELPL